MIPSRIVGGRYVVLGEVGRGRMGVVWRAEDRVTGRQVAVKELRLPEGLTPPQRAQFRKRLLREARAATRLGAPGIVAVHDIVTDNDVDHVVMELVGALSLTETVAAEGPLDEPAAARLGQAVLAALLRAHDGGVVHDDVQPGTVLLGADGRIALTDFGIVRAVEDLKLITTLVGAPGYRAPERLAGAPAAPAADLWALGATLFYAVAGVGPFERATNAETAHAVGHDDLPPIPCRGPLADVITGLLVRSPQHRLTGEQAGALLDAAVAGAPTEPSAAPPGSWPRRGLLSWWPWARPRPPG
ncbi:serine/threonine-protein kinase [Pseudonocardia acidicola]|uniref:non-specific serine/threonine protein kinase n=1 Tax=Pseudonocardia acidicola TaxID=2724939 RepID=A0ABX1SEX6_9PSEU|nr:serine/threonine-protein kinase [Pseudonocardia acidicola]NMH99072.1 serine/threonine protein kinase [Pseudonocardia acidicola]